MEYDGESGCQSLTCMRRHSNFPEAHAQDVRDRETRLRVAGEDVPWQGALEQVSNRHA